METICYQGPENIVPKENFEREKMVVKFKKEKDPEKKKKKRKKEEEGGDLSKPKKMRDGPEGGDKPKKVKVKKEKTEKEKKLQKEFELVQDQSKWGSGGKIEIQDSVSFFKEFSFWH